MSRFLTHDDVIALTGRKTTPAQIAWLKSHGWRHETTADGRPVVLGAYAEQRLGMKKPSERLIEPDFSGPSFRGPTEAR